MQFLSIWSAYQICSFTNLVFWIYKFFINISQSVLRRWRKSLMRRCFSWWCCTFSWLDLYYTNGKLIASNDQIKARKKFSQEIQEICYVECQSQENQSCFRDLSANTNSSGCWKKYMSKGKQISSADNTSAVWYKENNKS